MMDDKYLIFRLWFMFIEIGQTNPETKTGLFIIYIKINWTTKLNIEI